MPYATEGTLTTDKREIAIDETWDTQTEWEAYQSKSDVVINSGVLELRNIAVVDSFEASLYEDQSATLSTYYDGDLSQATRQQNIVIQGSYTLELSPNGSMPFIGSTSGLPNYPSQGDTFRFYVQNPSGGGRIYFYFFLQSATGFGGYRVGVRPGLNDFLLQTMNPDGTTATTYGPNSVSLSAGTTYYVDTTPQSTGDITTTLYNSSGSQLSQLSVNDTTYTSGGVGYQAENANALYDYVRLV